MFKSFTTSQTKPTSYREEIVARKRLYRPYVTDGLKVYYDWANRATKQDGVGRAYNLVQDAPANTTAIEYGGPTFVTNERFRYLSLDGTDDRLQTTWDRSSNAVTVEMIARLRARSAGMFVAFSNGGDTNTGYDIWQGDDGRKLGFNRYDSDLYGIYNTDPELDLVGTDQDNWKHYTFYFAPIYGDSKMYINSEIQSLSQLQKAQTLSQPMTIYQSIAIGGWGGTQWLSRLDIAEFKLYDRELSAREVAYNYGVAKSRKGV